ncbi:unnamed protein product [Colias eurytheme]|nr:unnamed protein product [Colias eurytheme]
MATFIAYCLVLILCYFIYRYKNRRIYSMLRNIKTAKEDIPLFGVSLFLLGNAEHIMNKMIQYGRAATAFGGITKATLGPFVYLVITDPASIEVVLKNCLEKDKLHRFLHYFLGNASIFAPVSIWKPRRKVTVPAFSPKIISSFFDIFVEQSLKLVESLKPMVGAGKFKIWPYINSYNLDSVMESSMGISLTDEDNYDVFLKASYDAMKYSSERIFHPWLQPDWIYKFFPQYEKLKKATEIIHDLTDKVIVKKKSQMRKIQTGEAKVHETNDGRKQLLTFLDQLISHSGGVDGLNNLAIREEVLTFILAASDTSAVAIGNTLKLLGKYPEIQHKVMEELDSLYGDSDRLIEKDDFPKLQYLERVIKESMRLFPPVPFIVRTATEDSPLNKEITIPEGTGIVINIYGVHRNPVVWGSDADCFDPDRFLPERMQGMQPCSFMPFSQGPRNCLGYRYAIMSITTVLTTLLRRYKVIGEPEKTLIPKIRCRYDLMMKAIDGYEVALELR